MMHYLLTLSTTFRRAEMLFGRREIVSRLVDKFLYRYTFADFAGASPVPCSTSASAPTRGVPDHN